MNPSARISAVEAWRSYCREHKPGHDFCDPITGLLLLGYLDGARAVLAYAESGNDMNMGIQVIPVRVLEQFVEELRQCYCQHYALDPDGTDPDEPHAPPLHDKPRLVK